MLFDVIFYEVGLFFSWFVFFLDMFVHRFFCQELVVTCHSHSNRFIVSMMSCACNRQKAWYLYQALGSTPRDMTILRKNRLPVDLFNEFYDRRVEELWNWTIYDCESTENQKVGFLVRVAMSRLWTTLWSWSDVVALWDLYGGFLSLGSAEWLCFNIYI